MRLKTKYFGEIDCPEEDKLFFPDGLFGFEEEKEFFLLPFEGHGGGPGLRNRTGRKGKGESVRCRPQRFRFPNRLSCLRRRSSGP